MIRKKFVASSKVVMKCRDLLDPGGARVCDIAGEHAPYKDKR